MRYTTDAKLPAAATKLPTTALKLPSVVAMLPTLEKYSDVPNIFLKLACCIFLSVKFPIVAAMLPTDLENLPTLHHDVPPHQI
jgi:hypothetical protein